MNKDAIVSHLSYFTDGRRKPFAVRTTRLGWASGALLGGRAQSKEGARWRKPRALSESERVVRRGLDVSSIFGRRRAKSLKARPGPTD
jgi:hypothetical protein